MEGNAARMLSATNNNVLFFCSEKRELNKPARPRNSLLHMILYGVLAALQKLLYILPPPTHSIATPNGLNGTKRLTRYEPPKTGTTRKKPVRTV